MRVRLLSKLGGGGPEMAKIPDVAFMIKEPTTVMELYEQGLGFEKCDESLSGARMVMDVLCNLALLSIREAEAEVTGTHCADGGEADQRPGINHFGFLGDNVDDALQSTGSDLKQGQNPQDGRPAEMHVFDPWGNAFDHPASGYFGHEEQRLPAVRQVTIQADRPNEVAEFHKSKLDLVEEAGRR